MGGGARPEVRVNQRGYRPWPVRPDPASGLAVHALDFSPVRAEGGPFRLEVGGARSHPFAIAPDLYRDLARDALAFFHLQRSGIAIDEARAPGYGRPAGHPGDASVEAWSGPDAERLYPGWSCPGGSTSPAAGTTRATTAGT